MGNDVWEEAVGAVYGQVDYYALHKIIHRLLAWKETHDNQPVIYLEPTCPTCGPSDDDRHWCVSDMWSGEYCEGCGETLWSGVYKFTGTAEGTYPKEVK